MALKHSKFWSIDNVESFQGFSLTNGEIDLYDDEYAAWIDDIYDSVEVAGQRFNASTILRECDPVAWRCGMGDRESEIQAELESQLKNEDDSDIEWIDDEIEEDEGEEE